MLVISRIRKHMVNNGQMMDVDEITHHLGIKLLGIVFDDDAVISSTNKGEPIVLADSNIVSQCFKNIARRLEGETVPLLTMEEAQQEGFFSKITRWFKRA